MKIALTCNRFALIDAEDFHLIARYQWKAFRSGRKFYAISMDAFGHSVSMSRLIMGFPAGKIVDHKNGDSLDNRRMNLRLASRLENNRNKSKQLKNDLSSRFKGVHLSRDKWRMSKWRATIWLNDKRKHLGYFDSEMAAAKAYDAAAGELFGDFALLNFSE